MASAATSASAPLIAIIAGVGPGTGAALARRFAKAYPVVLMARSRASYEGIVDEINADQQQQKKEGKYKKAIGLSVDVADEESVKEGLKAVLGEFGEGVGAAAAIFNASGGFVRKPFLDLTTADFATGYNVSVKGAFHFSQAVLPLLLRATSTSSSPSPLPPTLIFTGATASLRSGAQLSTFASGKFALRALSQSLAREFGPQGVHVSHAVIDGVIDIPRTKEYLKELGPDAKIAPDAIADIYWGLHGQGRSAWSWEVDVRPFGEKW